MSLFTPPAASSVLAAVTTVHLALASLRNHRSTGTAPVSSLAFVSLLLAGLPWLFPSVAGLVAGVLVHAVWYWACEHFAPAKTVGAPAAKAGKPTPAAPARPTAARPKPATSPAAKPRGFVQTPVLAVIDEAPDIRTFRFARPEGFDFTPGQFLTLRIRIDGKDVVRCYSISSSPSARGYLDISVKRQGLVSNLLHTTVKPATMVSVKAPAGAFVYPGDDDRPLLMLAGGIGITPLASMLRHSVESQPGRPVTLLYAAHREDGLAFRDELTALARRHPQVRLVLAAATGTPTSNIYPGRIDETLIRTTTPEVQHAVALICGPPPMIEAMRQLLLGLGVPDEQIRFERFEAAVAAAGARAAEDHATAPVASDGHQMRCTRSQATVSVAAGQTMLEAAEAGGVSIDSLCRAGICGTCRTRVVSGDVECETTALDESERLDGYVLACVTRLTSDCTVDA